MSKIVQSEFQWPSEWRAKADSIAKSQGKTRSEWIRDTLRAAIEDEGKSLKTAAPVRGGRRVGAGRKANGTN